MPSDNAHSSELRHHTPQRRYWKSLPKWFRILGWTIVGSVVLQCVLAIRIAIGLIEADEITKLRQHGAEIIYSWDSMEISPVRPPRYLIPAYLKFRQQFRLLVAGLFGRSSAYVEGIYIEHGTDSDLRRIADHFRYLKILRFWKSDFTADALRALKACNQIEHLDLSYTDLDDQCVEILEHFTRLKRLQLTATLVTDSSLKSLRRMPSLEYADLYLTDISTQAIADWRSAVGHSIPKIVHNTDEPPFDLRGIIRWSDGRRSANFSGPWHLIQEGPLSSTEIKINDSSSDFLGRNDIWWPSVSHLSDGDYRWTLKLGKFESKSVLIRVTDKQPSVHRFEFLMPVTKEQTLHPLRP